MQRPLRPAQQRAFSGREGIARGGRMMDPDMDRPVGSRGFNQPRFDPTAGEAPRVMNTAPVEQPIQAPTVATPRFRRRDADRADRLSDLANRNREERNRGRDVGVAVPNANLENQTGVATAPGGGQQREEHRRWRNRDRDRDHDRDGRNRGDRHRNWHERHEGDPNFDRKHRRWHNRDYWRRNYNRFVLFGGGYYYWNRGYWYPAYGYDPYYSTYTYAAPLYSYNGLPPGQVIAMVQTRLQQRGYYRAAVDGTYGPMTQQAIMNFQAAEGLPMTGEIDQETLNALDFD